MKQQRWNSVRATSEARRHGSNIMSIRRDNDRRKAYTLVEMLIASVLVAALMSVVWGMMSMYNGYLTAGQTQAVERQLTRSVLQLLEDDFQNVAVADTNPRITPAVISEETAPMQNTLSTESTLGDPLSEVAIAAEEPLMLAELGASGISESPGKISLIGNSSSIRLSIERKLPIQGNPPLASENGDAQQPSTSAAPAFAQPPGESEAASVEGVSPKVEEFETVIWQFQPPGQMAGGTQSMRAGLYRIQTESLALQAAMQQQETLLEQSGPQDDSSVDRTTLETLLYPPTGAREQTANAASSAADSTSAAETAPQGLKFDLIPEVVGCRIEYFSGSAWMSTWNSDQQQGLPVAVRIRLRFVNAANLEKLQQVFGPESTSDSPLDATVNDGRSAVPSETVSNRSSATDPLEDPFATIPTLETERIILLQPISGPMPQPGDAAETQVNGSRRRSPGLRGAFNATYFGNEERRQGRVACVLCLGLVLCQSSSAGRMFQRCRRSGGLATAPAKAKMPIKRSGVVLIVVLVLVMMVALAGFGFLSAMSTEYEGARLNGSLRQAKQTMASAESALTWIAGLSERDRRLMGGLHHNPKVFRAHIVPALKAMGSSDSSSTLSLHGAAQEQPLSPGVVDDRWRFSVISLDEKPGENSLLRFGLQNESSKLHLASLLRWEAASPGQGRTSLMPLPGMTEAIADAILDWLDADEVAREFGAESEYYQTLDRPYRSANAVPGSLTELLYVKGVTRTLLHGIASGNMALNSDSGSSSTSQPAVDANGNLASSSEATGRGWSTYLTVDSAERDRRRNGEPRIFLNAGTVATLHEQLSGLLSEELARYILLARIYGLTSSPGTGIQPSAAPFSTSMVAAFPVASLMDLIDSTVLVSTSSGPLIVQSPLQSNAPDFAMQVEALCDLVTTRPEQIVYGRIHLPTAPETVVRMIPGMTPELTSQLITQRDSLEATDSASVTWLLTRNVLDLATFRRVFPELTTGGDVFQTEIVVHRAIGGPLLRRNLVIDAASSPARRLHWTDLTDTPLQFPESLLRPTVQ